MAIIEAVQDEVTSAIRRRVDPLRPNERLRVFADKYFQHSLWLFIDYAAVLLDTPGELNAARKRERATGDPFPHVVAPRSTGQVMFDVAAREFGLIAMTLDAGNSYVLRLHPDSTVRLSNVAIRWRSEQGEQQSYGIGNLYLLSFGDIITADNCGDHFEDMLAKHIMHARNYVKT